MAATVILGEKVGMTQKWVGEVDQATVAHADEA